MLEIHNLHVATEEDKKILNGVNLRIGAGGAAGAQYLKRSAWA